MKKKKILIHSNYYKAFTGFGKNAKNILKYLYKTNKYDIVHFANGRSFSDECFKNSPWPSFGSLPDDPAHLAQLNRDPNLGKAAGYGGEMIFTPGDIVYSSTALLNTASISFKTSSDKRSLVPSLNVSLISFAIII